MVGENSIATVIALPLGLELEAITIYVILPIKLLRDVEDRVELFGDAFVFSLFCLEM